LINVAGDAGMSGYSFFMDQYRTPVLETIQRIREEGTYSFTLPGHRFGRGIDERTASVLSGDSAVGRRGVGGHFGFHPDPPTAAVQAGADLAVQSLHKADGGLCQASMILVGGDLVDLVDLRLRLDLITTTSPSALMYGSINGWRRHLALNGKELIDGALERADRIRSRLAKVSGLGVIDESIHGSEGVAEWDPLKLCVDVSGLGITGYQAEEWLLSERQIEAQLGNSRWVVCSLTYADDDDAIDRLADAFEDLAAKPPAPNKPIPVDPPLEALDLEQAMSPRDAYFAETE